jgi:hypothetical protein
MHFLGARNWITSISSVSINIINTYKLEHPFYWLVVSSVRGFGLSNNLLCTKLTTSITFYKGTPWTFSCFCHKNHLMTALTPSWTPFPCPIPQKWPNHYTPIYQIRIKSHKIARLLRFKLACVTIWQNKTSRRGISFFNHVSPMLLQAILHKLWIMFVVITYVNVILSYEKIICIMQVKIRVRMIGNVDQNRDFIRMPVHGLYFILNCKIMFLCKVSHWYNISELNKLQKKFKLHVLPISNKVMTHKILKLGLQVCNKFINRNNFVYKVEFIWLTLVWVIHQ